MDKIPLITILLLAVSTSLLAQTTEELQNELKSCDCFVKAMKEYADLNLKIWDLADYAPRNMSRGAEPIRIQHDCSPNNPSSGLYSHTQVVNNIRRFEPVCNEIRNKLGSSATDNVEAQSEGQNKLIQLAKMQYEQGKYSESLLTLKKAIYASGKQETNAEIILLQAKSYVQLGQMELADKVISTFYNYPVSGDQEEEMNNLINEMMNGTSDQNAAMEKELKEDVFTIVDEQPEFQGGVQQMAYFLQQNVNYPPQAIQENVEGTVLVSFVVTKSGKITRVKIEKGIGSGCDEEALRVVESFPDFLPGRKNGEAVNVRVVIPIGFRL